MSCPGTVTRRVKEEEEEDRGRGGGREMRIYLRVHLPNSRPP